MASSSYRGGGECLAAAIRLSILAFGAGHEVRNLGSTIDASADGIAIQPSDYASERKAIRLDHEERVDSGVYSSSLRPQASNLTWTSLAV